jgi:hypothetical protein
MEDEGRVSFIRAFDTRVEAEQWIATQKQAYFKPSDYWIAEDASDAYMNSTR